MTSDRMLFRVSAVGLALSGAVLLVLVVTSPADWPLWVLVAKHVPGLTVLAWATAGLLSFFGYLAKRRLSNGAKWLVFIVATLIASFPTRWLLVAILGLGEWLPPFGSDLWSYMVNPVLAELVIGISIALLGGLALSRPYRA